MLKKVAQNGYRTNTYKLIYHCGTFRLDSQVMLAKSIKIGRLASFTNIRAYLVSPHRPVRTIRWDVIVNMRCTIELKNDFNLKDKGIGKKSQSIYVRDIEASHCNISSNKDVDVLSAELIQSSIVLVLSP